MRRYQEFMKEFCDGKKKKPLRKIPMSVENMNHTDMFAV